jgi:H+-transporting ATPase
VEPAGIVLTEPGLGGIIACIDEGRSAFQRVLNYTLSILVNKAVNLVVLGVGLIMAGHAVLTPMLQALSMLAGDVVTMSRAADRAKPTPYPNAWRVRNLTLTAFPLGGSGVSTPSLRDERAAGLLGDRRRSNKHALPRRAAG